MEFEPMEKFRFQKFYFIQTYIAFDLIIQFRLGPGSGAYTVCSHLYHAEINWVAISQTRIAVSVCTSLQGIWYYICFLARLSPNKMRDNIILPGFRTHTHPNSRALDCTSIYADHAAEQNEPTIGNEIRIFKYLIFRRWRACGSAHPAPCILHAN